MAIMELDDETLLVCRRSYAKVEGADLAAACYESGEWADPRRDLINKVRLVGKGCVLNMSNSVKDRYGVGRILRSCFGRRISHTVRDSSVSINRRKHSRAVSINRTQRPREYSQAVQQRLSGDRIPRTFDKAYGRANLGVAEEFVYRKQKTRRRHRLIRIDSGVTFSDSDGV